MPKPKLDPNTKLVSIKLIGINTYQVVLEKDEEYFYGSLVIFGKGEGGEEDPGFIPPGQSVSPVLD